MSNLVIWGCGGHGRVILDIAQAMAAFARIVFYDDAGLPGQTVSGMAVISGDVSQLRDLGLDSFVIAIGTNEARARCYARAIEAGLQPATCIHPTGWISPRAFLGAGTVVMPRVVVQTDARVGLNCILNTGVIVEHDCTIEDHVHLSPGVSLGGNVAIGPGAHLGTGAIAIPGARIGARAIVGAGAVVLSEIPPDVTAVGVPARIIRQHHGERNAT